MTLESNIHLDLCGGVAGEYYVSFKDQDSHIARFMEQCAKTGVKRFIPIVQIGGLESHQWVICHNPCGYGEIEARGPMQYNEYGTKSPVRTLVKRAHERGMEVHPYVHVPTAGVWSPSPGSPVGEFYPLGFMAEFASDHPEYWTKTREGLGFADLPVFEHRKGNGYSYLSLAYPEVREYYISLCAEIVETWGVDGVTLEFVPTTYVDEKGDWTAGYDRPAIQAYREKCGVDPREVDNSDEAWIRLRAGYWTQFVRELWLEFTKKHPDVAIRAFETGGASNPDTSYRRMLDWPTWMEEGLIDVFYPSFYLRDVKAGSMRVPSLDPITIGDVTSRVKGVAKDRCEVYPLLNIYRGRGLGQPGDREKTTEQLLHGAKAAMGAGADGIGVYRADQIVALDLWDTLGDIAAGNF